jgi:DnaJ like chaperone protein
MYQQRASTHDVPTMLMALSAAVMTADGKVTKGELDYVKAFFRQQFGNQFNQRHLQVLKQFLDSGSIPLQQICQDIRTRLQPEVRIQLIHYLFGIAKADGHVAESEMVTIQSISDLLGLPRMEFESVKNMFYRNTDSDYKVLGVESTATDDEIKKAYRQMAIKFHPDKVASMGEEFQKGAKEKFQKIQEAYEAIKKQRGIK